MVAGVFVDFALGMCGVARVMRGHRQICAGLDEVIVGAAPLARHQLVAYLERVQVFRIRPVCRRPPAQRVVGGTGAASERAVAVGQHQAMMAVAVLEEIGNAPFLRQAFKECKVGLAVLDLVFTGRIAGDVEAVVDRERVFGEQVLQCVYDTLLLEDPEVRCQRGQEQPRAQRQTVDDVAPVRPWPFDPGHDAGDLARAGARTVELDIEREFLALHRGHIEIGGGAIRRVPSIRRLDVDRIGEQAVQPLIAVDTGNGHCGVAEDLRQKTAAKEDGAGRTWRQAITHAIALHGVRPRNSGDRVWRARWHATVMRASGPPSRRSRRIIGTTVPPTQSDESESFVESAALGRTNASTC
ncbi:hypothetical protein D9M68_370550 [compost metagenome]